MPRPSWETALAFPCRSLCACPISPPKASTIAWWPRQTPSVGTRGPSRRTISTDAPASSGRPGPGEMTRWLGARRSAPSASIASLRSTVTSAPSSSKRCARLYVKLS